MIQNAQVRESLEKMSTVVTSSRCRRVADNYVAKAAFALIRWKSRRAMSFEHICKNALSRRAVLTIMICFASLSAGLSCMTSGSMSNFTNISPCNEKNAT